MREWAPNLSIKFREIFILSILAVQDSLRLLRSIQWCAHKERIENRYCLSLTSPQIPELSKSHSLANTPYKGWDKIHQKPFINSFIQQTFTECLT